MKYNGHELNLIGEAIDTQLRLLSSYVNKSHRDLVRIEEFRALREKTDAIVLES